MHESAHQAVQMLRRLGQLINSSLDGKPGETSLIENCMLDTFGLSVPEPKPGDTKETYNPFANVHRLSIRGVDISVRGNTILVRPRATEGRRYVGEIDVGGQ